jgi:hypothetical protein
VYLVREQCKLSDTSCFLTVTQARSGDCKHSDVWRQLRRLLIEGEEAISSSDDMGSDGWTTQSIRSSDSGSESDEPGPTVDQHE